MPKLNTIATTAAFTLGMVALSAIDAAADGGGGHVVKFDDLAWQAAGDGAEAAILWGSEDDGDAIWVFRMQPGVEFPLHSHTHDYYGFAIQGNWVHIDADGNEVTTAQDAYAFVKGGDLHGDRCAGPEVCITMIDLEGPRDLFFPE